MEKFLKINVASSGGPTQLVALHDLKLVEQTSTTVVKLSYNGGRVTTITWPNGEAFPAIQTSVQNAVKAALATGWTEVAYPYLAKKDGYVDTIATA